MEACEEKEAGQVLQDTRFYCVGVILLLKSKAYCGQRVVVGCVAILKDNFRSVGKQT